MQQFQINDRPLVEQDQRRSWAMPLILAIVTAGLTISYLGFRSVSQQYQARADADFQRDAERRLARLEQGLARTIERVRSVASFYLSSDRVDAQEFRDFTAAYLRHKSGLILIGWAPLEFAEQGGEPDDAFSADELGAGVKLPLQHIEPGPAQDLTFGFDLNEIPKLTLAIEQSFRGGRVQYTVHDGNLIFVTPTLDQVDWSGVAVALLPVAAIADWVDLGNWEVALKITDTASSIPILDHGEHRGIAGHYRSSVTVDSDKWDVMIAPLAKPTTVLAAWATLVAGVTITGLLAILLFSLAGSAQKSTRLVWQRTRELEQAEAEARSQAVRLADEVSHTNQLISSIPSLLIGVDIAGVVTQWNRAVAGMSGLASSQVIGIRLADCGWQGDLPVVINAVEECLESVSPVRRENVVLATATGGDATLGLTITPILDSDGQLNGCLVVGADITDRNKMEVQLREAQRLEAVGRLAAGIAHEVNTPAQYVSDNTTFLKEAFADLLTLEGVYCRLMEEASDKLSEQQKQTIAQAQKAADRDYLCDEVPQALEQAMDGIRRIADIVRAMKEFSHPGGGGEKEQVDFNRMISNAITVAANEWKYHATVETQLDENLPSLTCYPRELNQVVLNLVINAAHAIADRNADSGQRGVITISTGVTDQFIQMCVSDTGTGIPEAVRGKIFEPFFTTKEVGRGSGQGLALAYSAVVEQHQGELCFETEINVGTRFIVKLPLQVQEVPA